MDGFLQSFFEILQLGCDKLIESAIHWNTFAHEDSLSLGIYVILFSLLIIILIAYFIVSDRYKRIVDSLSTHIFKTAIVIWVIGVFIYIVGYYGKGLNMLAITPRAIISSFKMFVVSHDLARIHTLLQKDALYMTFFSLIHFAAAFVSFMFIFKIIGYRIKAWRNIYRYKKKSLHYDTVHVFWGINEAAFLLVKDIRRYCEDETIIFIDIDEECGDCSSKKVSFNMVANSITLDDCDMERIELIGALIDHCYNGPAVVNVHKGVDVFAKLNLKDIGEIVQKGTTVHHYFLSMDEKNNIQSALKLQNDYRCATCKTTMHIHARKDANNEVLDHYSQYGDEPNRVKFKIVDTAYLASMCLKRNDRYLPVNCVDVDKSTGFVDSPFTALIVGFGGTGQEAFKFLYEYSAFIGNNLKKTPFKCYAIDEKMNSIAGLIRTKMPAIGEEELSLIQASVDSEKYWDYIKSIINELNYVVITLNNDVLGLSFAVNLFKYAMTHRSQNLPMLKIMLRCYDCTNENRMCEVVRCLNNSTEGINVELMIFGTMKELYNYNNILSDTILTEAKEFNRVYENSELSATEQWLQNFGNDEIVRLMTKKKMSRYHAIYDINRRIAQNISNSLHCRTKMILMGFGENEQSERLKLYYGYVKSRKDETTKYNCNKDEEQLFLNMAMVEHERWIASHKLMGYIYNPVNDCVKKHHKCICPWDELDEITQSYDCNVVDTTIKLAYHKAKTDKKQ